MTVYGLFTHTDACSPLASLRRDSLVRLCNMCSRLIVFSVHNLAHENSEEGHQYQKIRSRNSEQTPSFAETSFITLREVHVLLE